jgi:hypothetical protein
MSRRRFTARRGKADDGLFSPRRIFFTLAFTTRLPQLTLEGILGGAFA